MLIFNKSSDTFISSLLPKPVTHGFGTRMSGNGRNAEEIKKYLTKQHISYNKVIDPDQRHTDVIVVVDDKSSSDVNYCDGLITKSNGAVLTVITADCAPIIYADLKNSIVGISHNGRKGTELRLAQKMIKRFQVIGSELQDIRVALGPAIGACCYPMNILEENVRQLYEAGLRKEQIDTFPFCTKCDYKRFYSYRGSEVKNEFPEQFSFIKRG